MSQKRCEARNPATGAPCKWWNLHTTHEDRDGGSWANPEHAELREILSRDTKGLVQKHAGKATPPDRVDPSRDRVQVQTDVPVEAEVEWSKDAWVAETTRTFTEFLRARAEPFTTPENLWPLIARPKDMRSMVLPVRQMIRARMMHEVDSVRLKGTYTTRDGHAFAMNKIVPVYVSDIAESRHAPHQSSQPLLAL